jgi:hypothetical protein
MSALFKKLNLKEQREITVLNAPQSFEQELAQLDGIDVRRALPRGTTTAFGIGFAITQKELDDCSAKLARACTGDAVLWIAYPKKSSKKYSCEFNRDSGWTALGEAGFETVRMVAIDDDWSALRFRRVEFVKSMTRQSTLALTAEGKRRVAKK